MAMAAAQSNEAEDGDGELRALSAWEDMASHPAVTHLPDVLPASFHHRKPPRLIQHHRHGDGASAEYGSFNPNLLLQARMQSLLTRPARTAASRKDERPPVHPEEYLPGTEFEQFLRQFPPNEASARRAASPRAVRAMPAVAVSEQHVGADAVHCAVCKDAFELGAANVRQMPCSHLYHSECILPWLEHHNSCPLCRYEMPTDGPHPVQPGYMDDDQQSRGASGAQPMRRIQGYGDRLTRVYDERAPRSTAGFTLWARAYLVDRSLARGQDSTVPPNESRTTPQEGNESVPPGRCITGIDDTVVRSSARGSSFSQLQTSSSRCSDES